MISSIIVGIDGSDAAQRALAMACGIAKEFGATVQLCHTPKPETIAYAAEAISGFYVGPNIAEQEALEEAAEKLCAQAVARAQELGVEGASVHIGRGDPAHEILDLAEAANADLIVTGRRGLGDLGALVLGSISHTVSKHAKCACLTVP